MMAWPIEVLLLFILLALVAEIIGTIGAFGSSVFFVPMAAFFMDFHEVLGLTALFHVASNLTKIALFRKGLDKRLLLYMGIPSVIAVSIGAYATRFVDMQMLESALGFLLVGLSILFLSKPLLKVKPSDKNAFFGGALSGGLAGLLGSGGPIRGLTLAAFGLSKNVFVATSAFIDLGVDFTRSVVYSTQGYVDRQTMFLIPFLIGVSILGTYIGKLILNKIPQERFQTLVLVLILLIGLGMLAKLFY